MVSQEHGKKINLGAVISYLISGIVYADDDATCKFLLKCY